MSSLGDACMPSQGNETLVGVLVLRWPGLQPVRVIFLDDRRDSILSQGCMAIVKNGMISAGTLLESLRLWQAARFRLPCRCTASGLHRFALLTNFDIGILGEVHEDVGLQICAERPSFIFGFCLRLFDAALVCVCAKQGGSSGRETSGRSSLRDASAAPNCSCSLQAPFLNC